MSGVADHDQPLVGHATAGPGGVMTDEVGVITGDLTVETSPRPDGRADVRIQYTDADEWYVLTGSPTDIPTAGLPTLHEAVLTLVRTGGSRGLHD
ncbi:hypothetical protein [Embleya sp. AB8]|uniref:hypothetical protein n=1 Tax=Embleya sp. AB8 TaxID=3156304 RepID=UPI003C766655